MSNLVSLSTKIGYMHCGQHLVLKDESPQFFAMSMNTSAKSNLREYQLSFLVAALDSSQ